MQTIYIIYKLNQIDIIYLFLRVGTLYQRKKYYKLILIICFNSFLLFFIFNTLEFEINKKKFYFL